MVHTCVVWGCTNRADPDTTKRQFFNIPKVINHQGTKTERLSTERRNLWLARINRDGFNPDPNKNHYKVCSDHFITGRKADLYDSTNPDWAPSQKMGPEQPINCLTPDPQSSKKRYQRVKERQHKVKRFKAAEALLDLQKTNTSPAVSDCVNEESIDIPEIPEDQPSQPGNEPTVTVEMMRTDK